MRQRLLFAVSCALVALLATAVYLPGLHGPFVYDDLVNIIYNRALHLTDLNLTSLRDAALSGESGPLGRPVAMVSFALNYYFTQFHVFYFKLTNLLIHLLIGAGLHQLTRQLLQRHQVVIGQTIDAQEKARIGWSSLAVCALWLVHPLNLATVLYVVQRMASLATLFTVLGLLGYVKGREQVIQGKAWGFVTITTSMVVFGTLAVFSKEIGILLPIYVMVLEAIFYRLSAHNRLARPFKWFWLGMFIAPLAVAAVVILLGGGDPLGLRGYQVRDFTLGERLLTEARALWFYLAQILVPNISQMGTYHDDFAISKGLFSPVTTFFSLLGLAALGILAILGYRRYPIAAFAIAWFFAGHSLESTVVPLLPVQDHRNYLSQYGILLACVFYVFYPSKKIAINPKLRFGLLALYLALLAGGTYTRALQWKDEWTLYNSDVRNHPQSSSAHTMLGIIMHDNRYYAESEQHFVNAALLTPRAIEPMIRLVQHFYLNTNKVPQSTLDELDYRIRHYPFSGVTIWTFEALLKDTQKNPVMNRQLAGMFERLINRTDIPLGDKWTEGAYEILGSNYRDTGSFHKALYFYNKASGIDEKPFYYLASAGIHVKLKNMHEAQRLIREVKTRNLRLNDSDRAEMDRLEKIVGKTTPAKPE
jgi:protein O-mannosyl-transferase